MMTALTIFVTLSALGWAVAAGVLIVKLFDNIRLRYKLAAAVAVVFIVVILMLLFGGSTALGLTSAWAETTAILR